VRRGITATDIRFGGHEKSEMSPMLTDNVLAESAGAAVSRGNGSLFRPGAESFRARLEMLSNRIRCGAIRGRQAKAIGGGLADRPFS
jgi:hypothetical protein